MQSTKYNKNAKRKGKREGAVLEKVEMKNG